MIFIEGAARVACSCLAAATLLLPHPFLTVQSKEF
jgi:hypothetical protein